MADVDELLTGYKNALAGGEADPTPFLERATPADRPLLEALIDAYLSEAPRREFSAPAFRTSAAAPVAEGIERSLSGAGGLWPSLLPRLRGQARMRRAELVHELAARLGAQSKQAKVATYYHQMEQGLLPAAGVSDTVLEALGRIVGVAADSLRAAGAMPAAGPPRTDEGAVFARTTAGPSDAAPSEGSAPARDEWDEVDRLFRGGAYP